MEVGKSAFVVLCILAVFALFVAGTADVTGNIVNDLGAYTNPAAGLTFLVVFVIAVLLVLRTLEPEI